MTIPENEQDRVLAAYADWLRTEADDVDPCGGIFLVMRRLMADDGGAYHEDRRLIDGYLTHSYPERELIDEILQACCGYGLPTLVQMAMNKRHEEDSVTAGDADDGPWRQHPSQTGKGEAV
jgi:hypothetical protein